MSLFKNNCLYCGKKIDKDKEIFRNVKVSGFIGTKEKAFCCSEHANTYEKEFQEHSKKQKSGGSCCG